MDLEGKKPAPPPLYIVGRLMGATNEVLAQPYLSPYSSSPMVLGEALLDCHAPPPPPRRWLLLDGVFLNLSLSPCWIKAWETSPGCTCVERGGAVRSALDRIFKGMKMHSPSLSLSLLASPRLILVTRRKILNYCYVPQQWYQSQVYA